MSQLAERPVSSVVAGSDVFVTNSFNPQTAMTAWLESYETTRVRPRLVTALRFQTLADRWSRDCVSMSSPSHMFAHPAYLQIRELGLDAVPLIFQRVDSDPKLWLGALHGITGQDPSPPWHRGRASLLIEDWKNWGRQNGYLT
jgi:hypothetical protein